MFSEEDFGQSDTQPISHDDYGKLIAYLEKKNPSAVLPIQLAYYADLRIGEVCGLTWQDINLEEQYLTVKRSVRYDGATDVSTTMNVYAHATREAKRTSARLLDKVAGND